jgi:hypothetical protein
MAGYWDDSTYSHVQAVTNYYGPNTAYENALTELYNQMTNLTPIQKNLTADYATPIDWGAMQDKYTNGDNPPVDNAESQVAYLSFELGVALQMGYGVFESGAVANHIPGVLANNFQYDPSVLDASGANMDVDSNQMVLEIQWMRPFLVATSDHCWMIYGYNMGTTPWQFMMNLGWGGQDNGWATLDCVATDVLSQPIDITDLIYHVAPLHVVGFVGASGSGNGSPNTPYQNIEQAMTNAPSGATLIFEADSVNTFSGSSLVINTPLTLKGWNATITK